MFNEDGSVKFTQVINQEEAQALLQFALNFLVATGMSVKMLVKNQQEQDNDLDSMLETDGPIQ